MNILEFIGRSEELFDTDIADYEAELTRIISESSFLVLGGAGSIGQAVTKELFKRSPQKLHVIDISENNLVELVRDIRSTYGYIEGKFATYALDIGSEEYDSFINQDGLYDYVLNLSALKHVRSEKDPYTLMRMINTNIFNTEKTIKQSILKGSKKYFCVSTDKAANPVNLMGASKRIMEMYANRHSKMINISMARFANVAFSDGSLLHGFNQRLEKKQPIVAPNDIKRYFVTPKESGELCLMSCIFGNNRDIFFPKLSEKLHLITFEELANRYLSFRGYQPYICNSEEEARDFLLLSKSNTGKIKKWPCLFTISDTTGEKDFEEFFTIDEVVNFEKYKSIGIIKNSINHNEELLSLFDNQINIFKKSGAWTKLDIVQLFNKIIPDFNHLETGRYLDGKM